MEFERAIEFAVVSAWGELVAPNEPCLIHVEYENVPDLAVNSLELWTLKNRGYEKLICEYSISRSDPSAPRLHFANSYHSQTLADNLDFIMRNQRQFSRPADRSIHGLVQISSPSEEDKKRATAWSEAVRPDRDLTHVSATIVETGTHPALENLFLKEDRSATPDKKQGIPTEEQIRRRAYEIYEARGRKDAKDVDDWIIAERELTEQNNTLPQKTRAAEAR